jgi:hypothetical protein
MVRWHLYCQFVELEALILREFLDGPPAGMQDRPVQTRLLPDILAGLLNRSLGRSCHVLDLQILEDQQRTWGGHQRPAGLVGKILADGPNLPVVTGNPLGGFAAIGGPLVPAGEPPLPPFFAG